MLTLRIRPAEEKDIDSIASLEPLCFDDPWTAQMIRSDVMDIPFSTYVLGEVDEKGQAGAGETASEADSQKVWDANNADSQKAWEANNADSQKAWEANNADSQKVWEAGSERKLVGYVGIMVVRDECQVNNVAVHPDYRKKGIGGTLLKTALSFAKNNGAVEAFLEVREGNDDAISLYESMGFQRLGIRKGYYENNGENAVVMRKDLTV